MDIAKDDVIYIDPQLKRIVLRENVSLYAGQVLIKTRVLDIIKIVETHVEEVVQERAVIRTGGLG